MKKTTNEEIERVAVIGAGLMGFGIAVEFARFGYQVSIYNTSQASSQKAMERAKGKEAKMLTRVTTELERLQNATNGYLVRINRGENIIGMSKPLQKGVVAGVVANEQ